MFRCDQAITKFESLVNQVQKNARDIQERLQMIECVKLFKKPPSKPGCELPEAKVTRGIRYDTVKDVKKYHYFLSFFVGLGVF